MHRVFAILSALTLLLLLAAVPAQARKAKADKEAPDLVGVWKGTTQSVAVGTLLHTEASQAPKFLKLDFTITIDKQEGATFYGTKSTAKAKETLLGVVEGSMVYMVDDDGVMIGKLTSKNRMSVKYLHVTKDGKVASIATFIREGKEPAAGQ
jgi:hypothetical protein